MTKHQVIEELYEGKLSRTVLKTNGVRESIIEFNTFATLSDGSTIEAPKPYKQAKTKLGKLQYQGRHKQHGNRKQGIKQSNNCKKHYQKLAKLHYQVGCIRKDFLQKTTTMLTKKYQYIRIENLNVSGMISNHKLASAISDLGFYEFKRQLTYKSEWYLTKLDIIDQWFPSSKTCSNCGYIKKDLKLSDRIFNCDICGFIIDRDLNASINLAKANDSVIIETNRDGLPRIYACGQSFADETG